MEVETLWMYTGFAVWLVLAWFFISVLTWLGAQFLWTVWQKYGRYKRIVRLLDFLDENEECDKQFEEWLYRNGMGDVAKGRALKKYWKRITGRGKS